MFINFSSSPLNYKQLKNYKILMSGTKVARKNHKTDLSVNFYSLHRFNFLINPPVIYNNLLFDI